MQELEVFVAVVEANGFSAAAKRLDSTAAAVSRRVKALEERLGVRLLQRTTRRVQLTEAGTIYYREVRRLLDDLAAAENQLQDVTGEPAGDLRIVAPMTFGQHRLAPLVSHFALEHPRLRVTLILDDSQTDLVSEGFDLALRIAYPADSSLIARPLGLVPRYYCVAPAYLEQRGTPATPEDLLEHDCLHYNLISEREEWQFGGDYANQSLVVKGRFCSNNGEVLLQAAIAGLGIAMLPDFVCEQALKAGRLVRVLQGYEQPPLTLSVLYPSRQHVPAKARLMIDFLQQQMNNPKKPA